MSLTRIICVRDLEDYLFRRWWDRRMLCQRQGPSRYRAYGSGRLTGLPGERKAKHDPLAILSDCGVEFAEAFVPQSAGKIVADAAIGRKAAVTRPSFSLGHAPLFEVARQRVVPLISLNIFKLPIRKRTSKYCLGYRVSVNEPIMGGNKKRTTSRRGIDETVKISEQ